MFFGGIEHDSSSNVLLNTAGEVVNLRRKSYTVFVYLMENADRVVSKDELLEAVWPNSVAAEGSLTQCIKDIRRVLGVTAHDTLQTIPRRGYRLVSDPPVPTADLRKRPNRNILFGCAILLFLLSMALILYQSSSEKFLQQANSEPAIVITQFEDLTGIARWQRMAKGLSKNLVVELAKNSWLRILQLNDEENLTDKMIAASNPQFVVSGTLQAESNTLLITTQLKELPGNEVLWSEKWRKPATDLFSIQDEILQKINSSLGGAWTGIVASHGLSQAKIKPTSSLDAYELYLLAIEHKHKFTAEDNNIAIEYLLEAVDIDPDFGLAWSVLFVVYLNATDSATTDAERLISIEKQKQAALRAYKLLPNDPEVILAYCWAKAMEGDQIEVNKQFDRAVQLAWNNPDVLAYAAWAGSTKAGSEKDIVGWAERAIKLNTGHPEWYLTALAVAQFMSNQPQSAIETLEKTSDTFSRWLYAAGSYASMGDLERAVDARKKVLEYNPNFTISGYMMVDPILDPVKLDRMVSNFRIAGFP